MPGPFGLPYLDSFGNVGGLNPTYGGSIGSQANPRMTGPAASRAGANIFGPRPGGYSVLSNIVKPQRQTVGTNSLGFGGGVIGGQQPQGGGKNPGNSPFPIGNENPIWNPGGPAGGPGGGGGGGRPTVVTPNINNDPRSTNRGPNNAPGGGGNTIGQVPGGNVGGVGGNPYGGYSDKISAREIYSLFGGSPGTLGANSVVNRIQQPQRQTVAAAPYTGGGMPTGGGLSQGLNATEAAWLNQRMGQNIFGADPRPNGGGVAPDQMPAGGGTMPFHIGAPTQVTGGAQGTIGGTGGGTTTGGALRTSDRGGPPVNDPVLDWINQGGAANTANPFSGTVSGADAGTRGGVGAGSQQQPAGGGGGLAGMGGGTGGINDIGDVGGGEITTGGQSYPYQGGYDAPTEEDYYRDQSDTGSSIGGYPGMPQGGTYPPISDMNLPGLDSWPYMDTGSGGTGGTGGYPGGGGYGNIIDFFRPWQSPDHGNIAPGGEQPYNPTPWVGPGAGPGGSPTDQGGGGQASPGTGQNPTLPDQHGIWNDDSPPDLEGDYGVIGGGGGGDRSVGERWSEGERESSSSGSSSSTSESESSNRPVQSWDVSQVGSLLPGLSGYGGVPGRENVADELRSLLGVWSEFMGGQQDLAREAPVDNPFSEENAQKLINQRNALAAAHANRQREDLRNAMGASGFDASAGGAYGAGLNDIDRALSAAQTQTMTDVLRDYGEKSGEFSLAQRGQDVTQRGQDSERMRALLGQLFGTGLGYGVQQRGQDIQAMLGLRGQDVQQQENIASIIRALFGQNIQESTSGSRSSSQEESSGTGSDRSYGYNIDTRQNPGFMRTGEGGSDNYVFDALRDLLGW